MASVSMFNYWTHRKPVTTLTGPTRVRFFDDGTANVATAYGNWNDLYTSGGALPDNRNGQVTGLFFSFRNVGSAWTEAAMKLAHECINNASLELTVGGVLVQRGPLWAFCRPPEWAFGATGSASGFVQNGGYQLQTAAHPYLSQQTLSVELVIPQAQTTMTTLAPAVTIQTYDTRTVGI